MKLIRPFTVTDGALTSTNVTEADHSVWASGDTYALGDRRILTSPTATITLTVASPSVVTWTAHGLADDTPVVLTTTGALPTGLTAGQEYFIRDSDTNTFRLAATVGGAAINTSGSQSGTHTGTARVHRIYESLQGSNTNHPPMISPTWWAEVSATNRWKLFDEVISAQCSRDDTITAQIAVEGRIDSVALLNMDCTSVRVTQTDATDGVVYDETVSMVADSGIQDWYAYFFEPILHIVDYAFTDLLATYSDSTINITLTYTGNPVLCGGIVLGLAKDIGPAQYGVGLGIQDYSIKQRNDFGNYSLVERAFNKRAQFHVWVASAFTDALQNLLAAYRAKPIVYLGSDAFASTLIYGFFKDFSIEIAYPEHSICTIEIEGLT